MSTGTDNFMNKQATLTEQKILLNQIGIDIPRLQSQTSFNSGAKQYLQFQFKNRTDVLYVVFDKNEECIKFIDKLHHISET